MRYASITPADGLVVGENLSVGDEIGSADASMPGEAALGAHLHLEYLADGDPIDPESLPQARASGD